MSHNTSLICPCLSRLAFDQCCQPFIQNHVKPDTAEQLMRSRYTAYALLTQSPVVLSQSELAQYLVDTHHPEYRSADLLSEVLTEPITSWCSLRITKTEKGGSRDAQGLVEFVAFYRLPEADHYGQMHERSAFVNENGQWLYTTGEHAKPIKLSRNDHCWCGSLKKLKTCHPE